MAKARKGKRTGTRQWLKKACAARNSHREILHTIHTQKGRRGPVSIAADGYRLFVDYAPDVLPAVCNVDAACTMYNAYHVYDQTEIEPARYPDFQRIMPRTDYNTPRAVFVVKELEQALRQARVIAKHNVDSVRLSWDHQQLTVYAKAREIGDTTITLPLHFSTTPSGDVSLKGKFLLDALAGMKHVYGWARLYSPAPDVPVIVRPGKVDDLNGPDREAVIMPMRRN